MATEASPPKFPRFGSRTSVWPSATFAIVFGEADPPLRWRNTLKGLPKQPLHVIAHAIFERKPRLVSESIARAGDIGLRKGLIIRVRIIKVFGLEVFAQALILAGDEVVKRPRLARSYPCNSARLSIARADAALHSVLDVNEFAFLLAVLENARPLAGLHLLRKMVNHTCWHSLVRFARSVNVEVTQPDDDPIRRLRGRAPRHVVHDDLGKRINICWCGPV